jgi:hypothetical protein
VGNSVTSGENCQAVIEAIFQSIVGVRFIYVLTGSTPFVPGTHSPHPGFLLSNQDYTASTHASKAHFSCK